MYSLILHIILGDGNTGKQNLIGMHFQNHSLLLQRLALKTLTKQQQQQHRRSWEKESEDDEEDDLERTEIGSTIIITMLTTMEVVKCFGTTEQWAHPLGSQQEGLAVTHAVVACAYLPWFFSSSVYSSEYC